jgi:hypothetical protein
LDYSCSASPYTHGSTTIDWGFIPSKGEHGEPLDAMVLRVAACPVGYLIRCQPIAVLKIRQREKGKTNRNDNLLFRSLPTGNEEQKAPGSSANWSNSSGASCWAPARHFCSTAGAGPSRTWGRYAGLPPNAIQRPKTARSLSRGGRT